MNYRFNKTEKITNLKAIKYLFLSGKSFTAYPLKLLVIENPEETTVPFKVVISAPKRNLNLAVHRNKAKRHIREAYRLNKQLIYSLELNNKKYCIAFVYMAKTNLPFEQINVKLVMLLNLLKNHLKIKDGKTGDFAN